MPEPEVDHLVQLPRGGRDHPDQAVPLLRRRHAALFTADSCDPDVGWIVEVARCPRRSCEDGVRVGHRGYRLVEDGVGQCESLAVSARCAFG
eukprot:1109427-Pyramimonas_sp.AAC.1